MNSYDLVERGVARILTKEEMNSYDLVERGDARILTEEEMNSYDLVERGVARILTKEEMNSYDVPKYYLSHLEVMKRESPTPCRIVLNSSAKYMNECINDYWREGAKLVTSLVGVLVRFRENQIAIIGDTRKMYHAVKISLLDQYKHRFLWRNMVVSRKPDAYVMTSVSFGDKPARNIAIAAFNETAEIGKCSFPRAAGNSSEQ